MSKTPEDHKKKTISVSAAADTFAELEVALEALKPLYDRLHRQIGNCYDAGVGKHAEAVAIRLELEDISGRSSGVLAKLLTLHGRCTKIAIREGCDVPPNLAISGGLVQPLSGGR